MSGDTLVNAETGEIIAQCTPDEARLLCDRMHTGIGVLTELYVEAYQRRAWAALGYSSWDAFLAAEFGKYQLRLPSEERDETVMSMRAAGLSIRAIAATGVASKKTVERTIAASGVANDDTSTTGTDGKTYDAVNRAKARQEAQPAPTITPGKCTDGFDCPATPGPDGVCTWHRTQRAKTEPQQDPAPAAAQDPGKAGAPESRAAATGSTEDGPPSGAGDGGGTGDVLPTPPAETLPADWRDRIACAVHLLGCPVDLLRVALTDDDRIDLTDLRDHLDAVLAEPQEQT